MQVADDAPGPTRLDSAIAMASDVLRDLLSSGSNSVACTEVLAIGASRRPLSGAVPDNFERASVERSGASVLNLVGALEAQSDDPDCALSHVLVFSDQTMPAELPQELKLMWHQVGAPRANTAITGLRRAGGGFLDDRQGVEVLITVYGEPETPPNLEVRGPDGPVRVQIESDPLAANRVIAYFDAENAGPFQARLTEEDAFNLDDRIAFSVNPEPPLRVDWRATVGTKPPWLPAADRPSEANLRVLDVAVLGNSSAESFGPAFFLYDGYLSGAPAGKIGPFMADHRLLDGVNFDVFDTVSPSTMPFVSSDVLQSFEAVIQGDGAPRPWVAVRDNPRQVILPMPPTSTGSEDARRIAWIMFANALRWLDETQPRVIAPDWQDADGFSIPNAFLESDTARPLAEAPLYDGFLDGTDDLAATTMMPIWPWLLALAALFLLLERLIGLVWRPAEASA
ncbi:MAG: hypothetical protein ABJD13_10515 [Paracoccaceae bacterium]